VAASDEAVYQGFLQTNNIDPSKITKVPVQFDPAPLVNGDVDAFFSFVAEQPVELQVKGVEVAYFLLADFGYTSYAGTYVVTDDSLKNKRDQVIRFMRAEIKGWQDNIADPSVGAHLTVEKYGADLGLDYQSQFLGNQIYAEKLIQTPVTQQHGLLWMGDDDIQGNINLYKANGADVKASDLFTNEILQEIYQGKNRV
jgi:ABC-type nitrate/sulfonate/bicarbonate transport system substrate-binding protein